MGVLDGLFIGLLSSGFVCILIGLFLSFQFFSTQWSIKILNSKRPKNKQKRLRLKQKKQQLKKQKKYFFRWMLCLLILGIVIIGSAIYVRYYQATTLTAEDSETIVQSYFIEEEVITNLKDIENGDNVEKIQPKLKDVSSLMVSYGNRNLSPGMSEEGTFLLIRYQAMMKEIGTNIHALSEEDLANNQLISDYQVDLEKLARKRKSVFDYFKINEVALQQKK